MRNENANKLLFLLSTLFSDVIYLIAFLFLDDGIEFSFLAPKGALETQMFVCHSVCLSVSLCSTALLRGS